LTPRPLIVDALAQAAREISSHRTLEATLDAIVNAALKSVPGFDAVTITLVDERLDGTLSTSSGTGGLGWTLDSVQYELDEGPCVDAIRHSEALVGLEHVQDETRWPRYVPVAMEHGLRSQLGVQLYDDNKTLGGLNLYSTSSDALDPDAHATAEVFAAHAALALGFARREEQLQQAISSRKQIGQALGMVMERYGIDEDRAFAFLVRVSSHSNLKLRDVAQEIVDQGNTRGK
jgi:GAF domain-containing protein